MGLFNKIFGKPRNSSRKSTSRERELDAEIEQQLQRTEHLPRLPPYKVELTVGDQVRWSEASNGEKSGTVIKIVKRRGVGAWNTIKVLDGDASHILTFTEHPGDWGGYTTPASLYRTGARVTLASAIARHRRAVATRLGVTTQSPRVAHLGEDWGEYTEY
jgi:hypothetical protein